MSKLLAVTIALFLAGGAAMAQEAPATQPSTPAPSALMSSQASPDITNTNPAAPLAGANSFTQDQARARLGANGFTNIGALSKDANGVWRGQATKGGKGFTVAVDFQGNIVAN